MTVPENKSAQTLAALGATQPDQVAALFAEILAPFNSQIQRPDLDLVHWEILRQSWLGRKSGVLTQITDNWLKPATPELKRVVGQELNKLRAHVEGQIEARRVAIEAGAHETAFAPGPLDLSLPGVTRPIRSPHPIRPVFHPT